MRARTKPRRERSSKSCAYSPLRPLTIGARTWNRVAPPANQEAVQRFLRDSRVTEVAAKLGIQTADLAKALFSLPAVLGVEYGIGFGCTTLRGSQNNDAFIQRSDGRVGTETNRHGGMLGGISSGEPIVCRVAPSFLRFGNFELPMAREGFNFGASLPGGLPLDLLVMTVAVVLAPVFFPFHP